MKNMKKAIVFFILVFLLCSCSHGHIKEMPAYDLSGISELHLRWDSLHEAWELVYGTRIYMSPEVPDGVESHADYIGFWNSLLNVDQINPGELKGYTITDGWYYKYFSDVQGNNSEEWLIEYRPDDIVDGKLEDINIINLWKLKNTN